MWQFTCPLIKAHIWCKENKQMIRLRIARGNVMDSETADLVLLLGRSYSLFPGGMVLRLPGH